MGRKAGGIGDRQGRQVESKTENGQTGRQGSRITVCETDRGQEGGVGDRQENRQRGRRQKDRQKGDGGDRQGGQVKRST